MKNGNIFIDKEGIDISKIDIKKEIWCYVIILTCVNVH